ncbi:MAG: hypothetical protein M1374_02475 [Firmicutes bacterium]|nr:hypothetical protein [Bacillota bacterium]
MEETSLRIHGIVKLSPTLAKVHGVSHPFAILTAVAKSSGSVTTTTSAPIFILPNGTFFVELVIFLVVFGILARFIIPPVIKAMKEREELLASSLSGVTEAKTEVTALLTEADSVSANARLEARQIIENASLEAANVMADAKAKALLAYNEAFAKSRHKIGDLEKELSQGLESQADKLIVEIAATMISGGKISIGTAEAKEAYALAKAAKNSE